MNVRDTTARLAARLPCKRSAAARVLGVVLIVCVAGVTPAAGEPVNLEPMTPVTRSRVNPSQGFIGVPPPSLTYTVRDVATERGRSRGERVVSDSAGRRCEGWYPALPSRLYRHPEAYYHQFTTRVVARGPGVRLMARSPDGATHCGEAPNRDSATFEAVALRRGDLQVFVGTTQQGATVEYELDVVATVARAAGP